MNIVYKLILNKRMAKNEMPYFYIGSKSNCCVVEGKIIDKFGKEYYGSSSWDDYKDIVDDDDVSVIILEEVDGDYDSLLLCEREQQIKNDVVASPEYFNKSFCQVNTYSNPNYATYKHIKTNKIVRLPRDHPSVLCGDYVGVTYGYKQSEEIKKKKSIAMSGDKNPFYGKKHTPETMEIIKNKNIGKKLSKETCQKMSEKRKGVSKTPEHRSKIGRPGLIMLKNVNTGQCVRVTKEESLMYDKTEWLNLYAYKMKHSVIEDVICNVCGKKGKNNSSFKRWHNENCKGLKK
jgi:hypothetical protein